MQNLGLKVKNTIKSSFDAPMKSNKIQIMSNFDNQSGFPLKHFEQSVNKEKWPKKGPYSEQKIKKSPIFNSGHTS